MTGAFSDASFMRRWAVRLAIVWLSLLYARTAWVSTAEYELGAAASAAGRSDRAVAHYRRAARHFAPPLDSASEALDALAELATTAERAGDEALALSAWRSIRASTLAARSSFVPHSDALELANRRIAVLSAADVEARGQRSTRGGARSMVADLDAAPGEHVYGAVLALAGLLTFLAASHRLVAGGVRLDDTLDRAIVLRASATLVLGFVVFVAGLVAT